QRPRAERDARALSRRPGRADQCAASRAGIERRDPAGVRRSSHSRNGRGRRRRPAAGMVATGAFRLARACAARRAPGRPTDCRWARASWHVPRRGNPGGGDGMIKVMLVDDHAVVRTGFRLLLQSVAEVSVVAEAESGELACQRYAELAPDVVVMDLAMP